MAKLLNAEKSKVLCEELQIADAFWSRAKGLLGTSMLGESQAMWIHRCNSIHTFFMKYSIDCVFVDSEMTVKALVKNVKPGRMVLPIWGAKSVIEMKSGRIEQLGLNLGDKLYVGT